MVLQGEKGNQPIPPLIMVRANQHPGSHFQGPFCRCGAFLGKILDLMKKTASSTAVSPESRALDNPFLSLAPLRCLRGQQEFTLGGGNRVRKTPNRTMHFKWWEEATFHTPAPPTSLLIGASEYLQLLYHEVKPGMIVTKQ